MHTTVYFATNRAVRGDGLDPAHYDGETGLTAGPAGLTFGMAMVEGTDLAARASGRIIALDRVSAGRFGRSVEDDIAGGRNLLVFIHGFANSFTDSITRAAFNREFLAASGVPEADCTVLGVSWPSGGPVIRREDVLGGIVLIPITLAALLAGAVASPFANAYLADRAAADLSGAEVAGALDGLRPVVARVRAGGGRAFLLVHSMGNRVLRGAAAALAGPRPLFDEIVLAAADVDDAEGGAGPAFLQDLRGIGTRVSQYVSSEDHILGLSHVVNGVRRLGRHGPVDRADAGRYPPDRYRLVDCSGVVDDAPGRGVDASHQYYRRVEAVRDDIAAVMAGGGAPGATTL